MYMDLTLFNIQNRYMILTRSAFTAYMSAASLKNNAAGTILFTKILTY